MNALFIYTNINGFHEDIYSFGLASIVSVAREAGHTAKVLVVENKDDYSAVLDEVASFRPRVVGFTAVSSQFAFVKELAAAIKSQFPDVITVCGGVHPTIDPECLLEADALDGIFIGESESVFRDFLEAINAGRPYKQTDNFTYVENGNLVANNLRPLIHDLDILPYPDRALYPMADSIEKIGYVPFLFSRGCPYLCSYCSNHAIAKVYNLPRNLPRYRSAESSIGEIEQTMDMLPVRRVLVADDIFGLDKQWRRDFCREYAKRIARPLMCLLRANLVDDEFMVLLKDAGCCQISIGIESGNDHVRNDIMNRRMSREQIVRAFRLAHQYGIRTNAINMIGLPGETDEMIWDTIRLNRLLHPTRSGVNIFYPYKGTKLGDYCFENSLVDEEQYHSFSNERRESVLKFPEEYRRKLSYYHKHWQVLVYPHDIRKRLEGLLAGTFIWKWLRTVKHTIRREGATPRNIIEVNKLADPGQVRSLYEKYYRRGTAPDGSTSSHWAALGPQINVTMDRDGNIASFKGYGFGDLQYRDPLSRAVNYFCNLSYFVRLPFKKDLRFLLRKARRNLKQLGAYVTYDCFRQTCGMCVVRRHLKAADDECFNVLVIGDGYGFLSSLIKSVYPNARITLIDLGKILLFQSVDLQRMYPNCKHVLVDEGRGGSGMFDFRYVPAEHYSALADVKYKLIFNISAMQEMNYESIRGYFNFIRANATMDNLFYCCNRDCKELPGGEVIEFLNYPWAGEDRHLVDEYCSFVKYGAAAKWPFFHRFDGPFMHRLTNLATGV